MSFLFFSVCACISYCFFCFISSRFDFGTSDDDDEIAPENFSMDALNWLPGMTGPLLSISMWHRVCSWFVGSFIELTAVEMTRPGEPGKRYEGVFGVPVTFSAEQNLFRFHSRFLAFPVVQSEDSLARMLETYPADLIRMKPVGDPDGRPAVLA